MLATGALSLSIGLLATALAGEGTDSWPQWRGPSGTGSAGAGSPPVEWSEDDCIRWKVEVPGKGQGTPIVWGDRIYLMAAVPTDEVVEVEQPPEPPSEGGRGRGGRGGRGRSAPPSIVHEFKLLALDREDGSIVWESTATRQLPHASTHSTGSFAASSVVTDGEVLLAYFGSPGLFAYDMKGKKLWDVDLGDMRTRNSFGEGASPAMHGDAVVVNWDHEDDSFIVALNKHDGEERWRRDRDEATTWGTPLIVEHDGRTQVVVNGTTVRSYDLATGDEIWNVGGMTANPIPTPFVVDDLVFVTSGFRGNALKVIDLSQAEGNLDDSEAVIWSFDKDTPYVPTPVYHDGIVYFLKSTSGMVSAFDAFTGDRHFGPERLDLGNIYASPVASGDRVYITDREGRTVVLQHGEGFEVIATNELGEGVDASMAIVDDEIYVRGTNHLYCIAEN